MGWVDYCLQVKSQSAAKMFSSSTVRQMAAIMARLLRPRRVDAATLARHVVLRPAITKTGARVRAPSVNALNAVSC